MAEKVLLDTACTAAQAAPHLSSLPRRFAACYQPFRRPFKLQRRQRDLVAHRAIPHPATEVPRLDSKLDDELSSRPLELDEAGYFIIKVDREANQIVAEHYTNTINKDGLACDPVTGEVIPCKPGYTRPPTKTYRGRNAKELSVAILEREQPPPVTRLEHANYLGREFQRAEMALINGGDYIQD
ncbi:hypothetical protein N2152v2_001099 [Parachlorella kessleri]